MRYPVVIHKDSDSNYGVTVPDLPGCFSAGETLDEALDQTVEAIECHLEGLLTDGEVIPIPRTLEHHRSNPDYEGGVWAVVTIAERNIGQKILDGIRGIGLWFNMTRKSRCFGENSSVSTGGLIFTPRILRGCIGKGRFR
jgi:predicted RNase H-like HicB family nuclease